MPPQPLAELTKPSTRAPLGRKRCQRWEMRNGAFWQCPSPARVPLPVCPMHGAGSAKREREGERQSPVEQAALVNAAPRAVAVLLEQHPEYRELFLRHLNAPIAELLDFRPLLAAAHTLASIYMQKSELTGDYGPFGSDPATLRAINAINAVLKATERCIAIEAKLGPMTHLELAWLRYAYAATLAEFVPAKRLEEAKAFCRRKLAEARELGIGGKG